ncbi:MAG TPA: reverse transcriptase-like protein [Candidatus Acidoferrales bacterium]|nr:reverse transcriptase-like protein [Candidatus Acidoferrales bacterium]
MTPTHKTPAPLSARLFDETHAAPPPGVHVANIDGASRGNPGPAAYAVILRGPDGAKIAGIAKRIGRKTNNVAEYYALLAALDYAAANSIRALRVRSDSELLVRQMQGRYRVKNEELKPLYERAQKLTRGLEYFVIEHVPREQNSDADALANLALDGGDVSGSKPAIASPRERNAERPSLPLRIRARYRGGVLVPVSAVEIPEEAELELEIRVIKKS